METADPHPYVSRLLSRAWTETQTIWNPYRWWLSLCGGSFALALLAVRGGWAALMNPGDVVINAAGGCIAAFAGSWVISLIRSVKLLDDDRASELATKRQIIEARESEIARQSALLTKPPRSDAQEFHYCKAKAALKDLPDACVAVLRAIYSSERLRAADVSSQHGIGADALECLHFTLEATGMIRKEEGPWTAHGQNIWWEIAPGFKEALGELLFRPVTPPQA